MSKRAKQIHANVPVLPSAVFRGMYLAAWARAESCPISVLDGGGLELRDRFSPSDELDLEWADPEARRAVIGCLGWAVPLMRSESTKRIFAASWPLTFGGVGAIAAS